MNSDRIDVRSTGSRIDISMPVIFTCPHGGRVEFLPKRDGSNVNCSGEVRVLGDNNTIEVTEGIALNILRMSKKDVYKIIGIADRSFIDFNREVDCAYVPLEDNFAKDMYDQYHQQISSTIEELHSHSHETFKFLFDFHGTDNTEAQLFFGTDARNNPNKSTICRLLERNPNALWDNTGLLRLLQDKGYSTIPRDINDNEHPSFDGGFTVKKYGDCDAGQRVEAIQCEITTELRDRAKRMQFTTDMAECILKFIKPYVSQI